ncbi:MAG: DegV family protein [Firmicutes bacterium]|nr:DegV family protein [Bacillota bacterium]MDD4336389.1 DegV family protein [Bacillota bacterium]MDD4793444.1 DegV family protein [Bacillota bacterium]
MARVRIVTDSSNGIPPDIVDEYGITVVPIQIQFGTESFKEGVDLSYGEFYRRLEEPVLPTTSQPAPGDFVNAYKSLVGECDEILSLHLSSKASGTCQSARLAAEMIDGVEIAIVDTQTASMGTGLLTIAAAEAAKEGKSSEEITDLVMRGTEGTHVFVALPTLKYLRRSGRVPQVQAWVASLLSINPILTTHDGVVEAIERVRTFGASVRRMVELAAESCGGKAKRLVLMHANAAEEARSLLEDVRSRISFERVYLSEMGGSMAVHGGAGMLGIALSQV